MFLFFSSIFNSTIKGFPEIVFLLYASVRGKLGGLYLKTARYIVVCLEILFAQNHLDFGL